MGVNEINAIMIKNDVKIKKQSAKLILILIPKSNQLFGQNKFVWWCIHYGFFCNVCQKNLYFDLKVVESNRSP